MIYNLRKLSYPKNFIVDIFNHNTKKMLEVSQTIIRFPKDISEVKIYREDGLDFILSCLSEDEIRLIQYKYIDRKTVTWISRQFKTSVHEIERRLQRIRSKLTNPKRFVYILHDITEDNSKIKLSFDEESFNKIYKDDFIDLLDLPERTSNAIYRNNMYRISDILDEMERNHRRIVWYDRLRNVGRCSAKEIVNKLCELNFL